jgi:Ca-activated chloride channel family protein
VSISFAHPHWLALLAVPIAILLWVWRGGARRIAAPVDHATGSRGRRWALSLRLAESLPALLLAVAIALIAGPQRLGEPESKRVLTNIELCVDVSGSMTSPFGGDGDRYDAAMKSITEFVDFRKGDAFGMTFFGSNFLHWCPLTTETSAIKCATPFMRPEQLPSAFGGTMIGKALRGCEKVLVQRPDGDRMIVLVSDGDSFDLRGAAEDIVADFKRENITVFAIIITEYNLQDEIVNITQGTGGAAFTVDDPAALQSVFRRIDEMKPVKLERKIGESKDDFPAWCAAGLGILAVAALAALGLRATPW